MPAFTRLTTTFLSWADLCVCCVQTEGENQKKLFSSNANPCGKIEIFLMLNPMPAQLLRQTRTAPYSKKEITDVCQIHSQKKKRKRKTTRRASSSSSSSSYKSLTALSRYVTKASNGRRGGRSQKEKKTLTSKTGRREAIKQTTLYLHQKRLSFSTAHQQQLWHQAIMNILSRIVLTPKLEYKMPL